MAISTPSLLDTQSASTTANNIASGTLSPTANGMLIIEVHFAAATVGTKLPFSISDTFSPNLSWTKVEDEHRDTVNNNTTSVAIFYAKVGATPGSGVVTVTANANTNRRTIHSSEVASGFNGTTPVKQSKTNNAGASPLTITFDSTPDSDSLVLAAVAVRGVTTITKDADFTQLVLTSAGSNHCGEVVYDADPTDTTVGWSSGSACILAGAAIEIDAGGGTQYNQSVSGAITPTGALSKQANKPISGAITPSGAIAKQATKTFAGSLSSIVGTLAKQTNKVLSGAISSIAGTLTTNRGYTRSFSGTVTSAGSLSKQANKVVSGSLPSSGTISKRVGKVISGALSSIAGALSKMTIKTFAGTLTSSGALATTKTFLKSIGGTLTSAGALLKQTSKQAFGSISPSGTVSKSTSKSFAGTVAPSGTIAKMAGKVLSGVLSSGGAVTKMIGKVVSGTLPSSGGISKRASKILSGILSAVGTLSRVFSGEEDTPVAGEGNPVYSGKRENITAPIRNRIKSGKRQNIS